jgi:outer membrane protein assembly factor BamB
MDQVTSVNPIDGKLLWQVAGTTAATCGTMIWDGDVVFASGGYPKAETLAVKADGSGQVVWRNGLKCYEQSMIIVEGYIYALTDRGVLYCWRGSDGAEMWRERLEGPVSASPIFASGHIYWANEAGAMYVFRPNTKRFELAAQNQVGNEAFASPAISGDRLLLRVAQKVGKNRQEYLVCIGNP